MTIRLLLAALIAALIVGCGDGDAKPTPTASGAQPSATAGTGQSATAGAATPTAVATAPAATPTPAPVNVAAAFFGAWQAGNVAQMMANGEPAAVAAAQAIPVSTGWIQVGCDAGAGSLGCTWVRPGERIRERVRSIEPPRLVTEFVKETLTAEQAGQEFFNAWRLGNEQAIRALARDSAATAALPLRARASEPWSFERCEGAAGSAFCTWKSGASTLTMQIVNIEIPRLITSFKIEP